MATNHERPKELRLQHVLHCPCGSPLIGDTEDELVETAFAHLRASHPDMVDHYEREHVLFMAVRLPK